MAARYPGQSVRDIGDIRHMRDNCWQSAASQTTFSSQSTDPAELLTESSVMNAPQVAAAR